MRALGKIRLIVGILLIMSISILSGNTVFALQGVDGQSITSVNNNIPTSKNERVSKDQITHVVPGGESIGVELNTLGLLVVGHHQVRAGSGLESPGEQTDITVGDIILEINGEKVTKVVDVKPIVEEAGKNDQSLKLKIKRDNKILKKVITPIYDKGSNKYQIGLYIRDVATGIGTISFYDLITNRYGALGHVITDADTKKPLEISEGKIVNSTVTSIQKGEKGVPGEKQAKFSVKDEKIGTITKNSPFGIFGNIELSGLNRDKGKKPIEIAQINEVKKGPAQIMTVIDNDKVETFDIEIINTSPQREAATKGMIIKITDERLLAKTGGIVQGMSGSPIIQDGKLIGAVTHVFVNDPTSGYGVHIKWMLDEAGVNVIASSKIAS